MSENRSDDFSIDLTGFEEPDDLDAAEAAVLAEEREDWDDGLRALLERERREHGLDSPTKPEPVEVEAEEEYPGVDWQQEQQDKKHTDAVALRVEALRVDRDARVAFAVEMGAFGLFDPNKLVSFNALGAARPNDYILAGWLERGATTMLFADGHVGKSYVALDWACSVAAGASWDGRAVQQGRVLYVAAEGRATFTPRLAAWQAHVGARFTDRDAETYPYTVNMMDPASVASLASWVKKGRYDLILIDTLQKTSGGRNENSTEDMGVYVGSIAQVQEAWEPCHIVVLHHSKKDDPEQYRGSSTLWAGFDNVVCIRRELLGKDPLSLADPRRRIIVQKFRNGRHDEPLTNFVFTEVAGTTDSVLVRNVRAGVDPVVLHLIDMTTNRDPKVGPVTRTELKKSLTAAGRYKDEKSANARIGQLVSLGALVVDTATSGVTVGVIGRKG